MKSSAKKILRVLLGAGQIPPTVYSCIPPEDTVKLKKKNNNNIYPKKAADAAPSLRDYGIKFCDSA